jgi:uncharacterized protein YbjQ (UPF0145 family)
MGGVAVMSLGKIPVGRTIVRAFEAALAAWFIKADLGLFLAGKHDAAVKNVILTVAVLVAIEALMWLIAVRSQKKWSMSSDEVVIRGIQVLIIAAMVADVTSWLITGEGFGVHQPGCLLSTVILEGIIRRFIRPDPRPSVMAHALTGIRKKVKVFTHLPSEKVQETLGLVRGISDIEASSRLDFELAEQEALYLMLVQARKLGANAVVDARLTTGTYETNGSQWQVSRPVYTGTAVRI